ncbi:MAG TPA: phosphoribosylformylglycinamidine synthase subunit PurQ [Candidatus Limnocylindrales bacterium]|nr:phosphoribosylformylglycinamidine synthase subunit PurQ [Candidatus Limnocylindrales bacterium]
MKIGVVTFPGSLDDGDAARAARIAGAEAVRLWHADPDLHGVDAIVLPGGFSYGDYLRCGAIARFAPVMESIKKAAADGMPILGICNGFQILCEAHMLPGALTRNQHLHFRNRDQRLCMEDVRSSWTVSYESGQELLIPVKNGEGCFVADERTLDELEANGQIVARYIQGNPNGSMRDIAAIRNEAGNVVGIMPHPEHAVEALTGPSLDGLGFFTSVLNHLAGGSAVGSPAHAAEPVEMPVAGSVEISFVPAGANAREVPPESRVQPQAGEETIRPEVPASAIRPEVPVPASAIRPEVPVPASSIRPEVPVPASAIRPEVPAASIRPEVPAAVAWPEIPPAAEGESNAAHQKPSLLGLKDDAEEQA